MKDKIGRNIDYMRISLTQNCNLRCVYCMPDWSEKECLKNEKHISENEIKELVEMFSEIGIKKIRLTGGEPLLRKDLSKIISSISKIENIEEICMTTNGVKLNDKIEELRNIGLDRINISLDSLDSEEYKQITRGGDLLKVLKTIKKALKLEMKIKINSVITNTQKFESIEEIAKLTISNNLDVRFIEIMPIGLGKEIQGMTGEKVLEKLKIKFDIEDLNVFEGTSKYYKIKGAIGRIGLINPMSQCFCESCNKIRITSDCQLKSCLSSNRTLDLREILDMKVPKNKKIKIISDFIFNREKKNIFSTSDSEIKNMNQIGG